MKLIGVHCVDGSGYLTCEIHSKFALRWVFAYLPAMK